MIQREEWNGFEGRKWREEVNVRDFVQNNYTPYDGDQSFLAGPTDATKKLFDELQKLQRAEFTKKSVGLDGKERTGVLDMDTDIVTGITAHKPGYINESMKDLEQVVGLQTDKPLKRAFMPFGGIKMAEQSTQSQTRNSTRFSQNTTRLTQMQYLMYTLQRSARLAQHTSLLVCLIHTDADALQVTTAVLLCMVLISLSNRR